MPNQISNQWKKLRGSAGLNNIDVNVKVGRKYGANVIFKSSNAQPGPEEC